MYLLNLADLYSFPQITTLPPSTTKDAREIGFLNIFYLFEHPTSCNSGPLMLLLFQEDG